MIETLIVLLVILYLTAGLLFSASGLATYGVIRAVIKGYAGLDPNANPEGLSKLHEYAANGNATKLLWKSITAPVLWPVWFIMGRIYKRKKRNSEAHS